MKSSVTTKSPVTIKEAAKLLGIHHNTGYRYVKEGIIPAFRLGRRSWRVSVADMEALLNEKSITTTDQNRKCLRSENPERGSETPYG